MLQKDVDSNAIVLVGQYYPDVWRPGVNTAQCRAFVGLGNQRPVQHLEPVPAEKCTCGYWFLDSLMGAVSRATKPPSPWIKLNFNLLAIGAVSAWGKVIEHKSGYRAERATVIALYDYRKDAMLHHAAKTYDVPVYSDYHEMVAFSESMQ